MYIHGMNTKQRIEYLKQMIDEARSEGLNNIANLYCDELVEANSQMMVETVFDKEVSA